MPTVQQLPARRLAFPTSFMFLLCSVAVCLCATLMTRPVNSFQPYMFPRVAGRRFLTMQMSSDSSSSQEPTPTTFREAEVLGLKLMQQGDYELALKGTIHLIQPKEYIIIRTFFHEPTCFLYFSLISLSSLSSHSLPNGPKITGKPIRCRTNQISFRPKSSGWCIGWI